MRFVLCNLVTGSVWRDGWDEADLPGGSHVGLDRSTDCYGVFPSTLDFTMRLAGGRSNSPALMSLQTTTRPIAIAPSFPESNAVIDRHLDSLAKRPNVSFTQRVPAFSVGRMEWGGQTGFFMPLLLMAIESLIEPPAARG